MNKKRKDVSAEGPTREDARSKRHQQAVMGDWEPSADGPFPLLVLRCTRLMFDPHPLKDLFPLHKKEDMPVNERSPEESLHAMAEHCVAHDQWMGDVSDEDTRKWWTTAYLFRKRRNGMQVWGDAIGVYDDIVRDEMAACYGACAKDKLAHPNDLGRSSYDSTYIYEEDDTFLSFWSRDLVFDKNKFFVPIKSQRKGLDELERWVYAGFCYPEVFSSGVMHDHVASQTCEQCYTVVIDIDGALCELWNTVDSFYWFTTSSSSTAQYTFQCVTTTCSNPRQCGLHVHFPRSLVSLIVNYAIPHHFLARHRKPETIDGGARLRFWFRGE